MQSKHIFIRTHHQEQVIAIQTHILFSHLAEFTPTARLFVGQAWGSIQAQGKEQMTQILPIAEVNKLLEQPTLRKFLVSSTSLAAVLNIMCV